LPQGEQQVVIVQEMGDGIIAGKHHVELTLVMGVKGSHVGDREINLNATSLRFNLRPGDRPFRQVRGSDEKATLR